MIAEPLCIFALADLRILSPSSGNRFAWLPKSPSYRPLLEFKWRKVMSVRNLLNVLLVAALVASTMGSNVAAQSKSSLASVTSPAKPVASGYDQPPKNILDVMRRALSALSAGEPDAGHDSAVCLGRTIPSISRVATPFLRLAGVRVEPRNHSKHDTPGGYGITPCARSFDLVHIADRYANPCGASDRRVPGRSRSGPPTENDSRS